YSSVLLDKHSIPHCHSASTPALCRPSIMGGQIKLKSWRDDVTGHSPGRQYLCHLLNPDPMRATFPPEKATSVTMSTFCDGSITRPPHLFYIVMGNAALCITAKSFVEMTTWIIRVVYDPASTMHDC